MAPIAFVTDSTAYLPEQLVNRYKIIVVPQVLIWGKQSYLDGVDITPYEFYDRLKSSKILPTTSQVSATMMASIFRDLVKKRIEVLGIFISANLSGTFQSAIRGRDSLDKMASKIVLVDSHSTSMAMGFQILSAARLAESGANVKDCKELIEKARAHVGVYFAVNTLEFLHRGGRIGGAQLFIGSALNLKPILGLKDGRVVAEDRVRTMRKAIDRLIDLVADHVIDRSTIRLAALHANAEEQAVCLLDQACKKLDPVERFISSVSPVVGVHAGPGTVGLAYMEGI
jgi:DegV family protein with EDD domain